MIEMTPFLTITLLSLGLSFLISVIYRVLTKPSEVRKVKEDMKFFKAKMSEAKKAGDNAKSNEYASEMLKASQSQFRMSMKPMMASMLIFVMLLGWINTNFGAVVVDDVESPEATFSYNGKEHNVLYELVVEDDTETIKAGIDFDDNGEFSSDEIFLGDAVLPYSGALWKASPATQGFFLFSSPKEGAIQFDMFVAKLPFSIPFIGEYLSWFWWYIFISIPTTIIFRKLLGVE